MSSDYAQPDTHILCSLLQLNSNLQNNNSEILLSFNPRDDDNDCNMSDNKCEKLATEIRKLFEGSGWILRSTSNKKFKIEPYGPSFFFRIAKRKNNFFY